MTAEPADVRGRLRLPLTVHFEGPGVARHTLLLRDFLVFGREIQTALDRVARILQGYSDSVQPGRRLADTERACSLEVVSFEGGGSVTLTLDLPPLKQAVLPTYTDVGEEALRTLVAGFDELSEDQAEMPAGYDDGVLMSLREAGRTFERGVESVSFTLGQKRAASVHVFDRSTVARIVRRIRTPIQNQKVVEGRLLMADFRESTLRCRVHPAIGSPILCDFDEGAREAVLSALTHIVRIVGEATEVQGEIQSLRIQDIEVLDAAVGAEPLGLELRRFEDRFPSLEELSQDTPPVVVGDLATLGEGVWPPEDSVDEFIQSVKRWRKAGGVDRSR